MSEQNSGGLRPTIRVAKIQHPERFMNRTQLETLVVELEAELEAMERALATANAMLMNYEALAAAQQEKKDE